MSKTRNQRKRERAKNVATAVIIIGAWAVVGYMMVRALDHPGEQLLTGEEHRAAVEQYSARQTAIEVKALPKEEPEPAYTDEELPKPYEVPLDADLQAHIRLTCEEYRINPYIVLAVIWQESGFNADAVGDGGNSLGLMQIQPRWHSGRMEKLGCEDLLDPYDNVVVGIDYLSESIRRYDGDVDKALVAYNQGHYNGTITDYAKSVLEKADELRGED